MKILTFDIEDWFHILDHKSTKTEADWGNYKPRIHANMERIFQLLEKTNQSATFFCLGWIARKHPDIIKAISEKGYEVATHSDMHQLAFEQSEKEFKADLDRSVKQLQDLTGKPIRSYRAPGFSIKEKNKHYLNFLLDLGIEIDCSIFPAERSHGGFAEAGLAKPFLIEMDGRKLKEFPINTFSLLGKKSIYSGGGYFRLFPYWFLNAKFKQDDYIMTYFHPRDFDPGQPMIADLSMVRKFKSYYGLGKAYKKLEKLMTNFNFVDLQAADQLLDWNNQEIITFS